MKIITKISLILTSLNIAMCGTIAAQPVQEPIPEIQWQKEACAFLAVLHPRLGSGSSASQLPQSVARDIVESIKPKEEYGFIKNLTSKPIVYFVFREADKIAVCFDVISRENHLDPRNRFRFIGITSEQLRREYGYYFLLGRQRRYAWSIGESRLLFNIYIRCDGEPEMRIKNVQCFDLMNFKVYKEGERIRLEVTSPNHKPENYCAEQVHNFPSSICCRHSPI